MIELTPLESQLKEAAGKLTGSEREAVESALGVLIAQRLFESEAPLFG